MCEPGSRYKVQLFPPFSFKESLVCDESAAVHLPVGMQVPSTFSSVPKARQKHRVGVEVVEKPSGSSEAHRRQRVAIACLQQVDLANVINV